jgi:hypothetical protein
MAGRLAGVSHARKRRAQTLAKSGYAAVQVRLVCGLKPMNPAVETMLVALFCIAVSFTAVLVL